MKQTKAQYIDTLPVVGSLKADKDVYAYRGYRYSVFYHPIYRCYQIGIAAPHKRGWSLLGRDWRDVAVTSAKSLKEAHTLAQAEIDRMVEAVKQARVQKKKHAATTC